MSITSTESTNTSNRSWLDTSHITTPHSTKSTPTIKTSSIRNHHQLHIGDRVQINSMNGTIRFLGPTQFKAGTWAGIELDDIGHGKNDGSVDGTRYFVCPPNTGLFVLAIKVMKQQSNRPPTPHYKSILKSSKSTNISSNRIAASATSVTSSPLPPLPISSKKDEEIMLLKKKIHQLESENNNHTYVTNKKISSLEQTITDVKRASMESMEILESMVSTQSNRAQQLNHLLNLERQKNQQLMLQHDDLQKTGLELIEEVEKQNQLLTIERKEKNDMLTSHHINIQLLLHDIDVLEMVLQDKMIKHVELTKKMKQEYLRNVKLKTELKGLKKQERYSTLYMRDRLDTPIEEVSEEEEEEEEEENDDDEEELLDDNILCVLCEQKGHDLIHCNIIMTSSASTSAASSDIITPTSIVDQSQKKHEQPIEVVKEKHYVRNRAIDAILFSIL